MALLVCRMKCRVIAWTYRTCVIRMRSRHTHSCHDRNDLGILGRHLVRPMAPLCRMRPGRQQSQVPPPAPCRDDLTFPGAALIPVRPGTCPCSAPSSLPSMADAVTGRDGAGLIFRPRGKSLPAVIGERCDHKFPLRPNLSCGLEPMKKNGPTKAPPGDVSPNHRSAPGRAPPGLRIPGTIDHRAFFRPRRQVVPDQADHPPICSLTRFEETGIFGVKGVFSQCPRQRRCTNVAMQRPPSGKSSRDIAGRPANGPGRDIGPCQDAPSDHPQPVRPIQSLHRHPF